MVKSFFRKEVIIGICAILAIIILIFGIDYLKGINLFKPANYYYVSYTDVNGLSVSAPVTINGFKVGQVRDIQYEYDNPGHILVELSLNKELQIPRGTKAILKTDLLGTASICLELPSHNDMHGIGDKIIGETDKGLMNTVSEKVMPAVDGVVNDILPKIDSLITSLNLIAGNPSLMSSVERLNAITAHLEGTLASINQSVKSLPSTMRTVGNVASNIDTLSLNLVALSNELKELPIKPMIDNFNVTSENLAKLSDELNNPNSTLGLLLHDRQLYDNVNSTVSNLDSLFIDIKKNPKRYISIKLL